MEAQSKCARFAFLFVAMCCCYCQVQGSTLSVDDDVAKISTANIEFSINLYKKLIEDKSVENVVFSPLSVSVAMAMTHVGAKGETAKQIAEAFQFSQLEGKFHSAFGELHRLLFDKSSDNVTILSSNRVFSNLQMLEDYKNALTVYDAQVQSTDFAGKPQESLAAINQWISDATRGKIATMMDDVSADVAMVIANAVYFRGDWHSKFSEQQTKTRNFFLTNYTVVKTPFMFQQGTFRFGYVHELTLQILELPYAGREYSMVILLPKNFDLARVEANLNPDKLTQWLSTLHSTTVDVTLPKFKLKETLSLHNILPKLGVTDVFDSNKSDLSGMAQTDGNLSVDQILHKASIEVDEEGSVAVAATTMAITTCSLPANPSFHADQPFLWAIRHRDTGLLLFLGRLTRPPGALLRHDEF